MLHFAILINIYFTLNLRIELKSHFLSERFASCSNRVYPRDQEDEGSNGMATTCVGGRTEAGIRTRP